MHIFIQKLRVFKTNLEICFNFDSDSDQWKYIQIDWGYSECRRSVIVFRQSRERLRIFCDLPPKNIPQSKMGQKWQLVVFRVGLTFPELFTLPFLDKIYTIQNPRFFQFSTVSISIIIISYTFESSRTADYFFLFLISGPSFILFSSEAPNSVTFPYTLQKEIKYGSKTAFDWIVCITEDAASRPIRAHY